MPHTHSDADPTSAEETRKKLTLAERRLDAVLQEIKRIAASEFAYRAAEDALDRVRQVFEEDKRFLGKLDDGSHPDSVDTLCRTVLTHLHEHLPILGLILRSTNVRNAFELHAPLVRLAWRIIGKESRVVLSSEWEYSPMIFLEAPSLREFVFIGFPAHESGNPFITPLAGHELGHALWSHDNHSLWRAAFENQIEEEIVRQIVEGEENDVRRAFDTLYPDAADATEEKLFNDLFYRSTWQQAFEWAAKQCEEYFCDLVGIRIFGESFLHAFAYLLRPSFQGERSVEYPNYERRIAVQVKAAEAYGYPVPTGYSTWFEEMSEPSEHETLKTFLLGLADRAADQLCDELIRHVETILNPRQSPQTAVGSTTEDDTNLKTRIENEFKSGAPPERVGALAPLLNAAWSIMLSEEPLQGIPPDRKEEVLRELLLKAMEVLEYETRTSEVNVAES